MNLLSIFILAIISESVWETLKMVWQKGKLSVDRIGALVIALIVSFGTDFDIMDCVGIPMKVPVIGVILTAILISRGSNFIHDLITKISDAKEVIQEIEDIRPSGKEEEVNRGVEVKKENFSLK